MITRPFGRPGRALVQVAARDQPLVAAVGPHHADAEHAALDHHERDQVAARRPGRAAVAAVAEADPGGAAAAAAHDVEQRPAAAVGVEHDPAAVGREGGRGVDGGVGGQPRGAPAGDVPQIDVGVAALRQGQQQACGRPARSAGAKVMPGKSPSTPLAAAVDVDRRRSAAALAGSPCRRSGGRRARSAASARGSCRRSGSGWRCRPGPSAPRACPRAWPAPVSAM